MDNDYRGLYQFGAGWLGGGSSGGSNTKITITDKDLNLTGAPKTIDGTTVGNLLGVVYFIAGIVAVLAIIIGGVRYVGANGDSNQISAAKNTITYAVIGLAVVIMAAGITQFILQNVAK